MKITDVRMEMFKWPRAKPIADGLYTYTHNPSCRADQSGRNRNGIRLLVPLGYVCIKAARRQHHRPIRVRVGLEKRGCFVYPSR